MSDTEDKEPQAESEDNQATDDSVVDDFVIEKEDEQPKDTIKRLRERLKEAVKDKQEYLDGWQRAKADAVNQKKSFSKEREAVSLRAKEALVQDILPVLDSFQMAMANKETWQQVDKEWRTGVEQIQSQLISALKSHGVEKIAPEEGDAFDPGLHSSVDTEKTEEADRVDTVAAVEKVGYRIEDRIIRSADVVVYKE